MTARPKRIAPRRADSGVRPRMAFETWLQACTPRLWNLKVESRRLDADGPHVRATLPCPEDRDVANAIALAGYPAGVYIVSAWPRHSRGETMELERKRIRLAPYDRISSTKVVVTAAHADSPAVPREPAGSVKAEQGEAVKAELRARTAAAEAEIAEAKARARRAGAVDEAPARDSGLADVFKALLEQQRAQGEQQQALFRTLLEDARSREQQALELLRTHLETKPDRAAVPGSAIGQVLASIRGLNDLRELLRDDIGAGEGGSDSELVGLVKEARQLFSMLPGRQGAAAPASAAPQLPAAPAVPDATSLMQDRVAAWVGAVVREAAGGSEPEAAADLLCDGVGLLPLPIRTALDRGDWSAAWVACVAYLPADAVRQVGVATQAPAVQQWLDAFARSIAETGDDQQPETEAG